MPSAAIAPSRELGRLLRARRTRLGLSLSEVARRLDANGSKIPHSTLGRIEQGKLDAGVRRLHQLLRLYEIPAGVVADLVSLEDLAAVDTFEGDADSLYERAVAAWRAGEFSRGLGCFLALRDRVGTDDRGKERRHRASLGLAIAARDLGRMHLAKMILEDLLLESPTPAIAIKTMVVLASIWSGLGSLDVAFAFLRLGQSSLPEGFVDLAAFATHQEARLLLAARRLDEAEDASERSIRLYRECQDRYGEARSTILRIRVLAAASRFEDALETADRSIDHSEEFGFARLAVVSRIEKGRVLTAANRSGEAIRVLREAASAAIIQGDWEARFRAHVQLSKAHDAAGEEDQARTERNTAHTLLRFADDGSEEAREIRSHFVSGGTHVA